MENYSPEQLDAIHASTQLKRIAKLEKDIKFYPKLTVAIMVLVFIAASLDHLYLDNGNSSFSIPFIMLAFSSVHAYTSSIKELAEVKIEKLHAEIKALKKQ